MARELNGVVTRFQCRSTSAVFGRCGGTDHLFVSFLVAAVMPVLAGCCGPPTSLAIKPSFRSIIIIDIDTLRADHLGCYGYHRPTSPFIDKLATGGTRFAWAFSQAPNTPPSQASILTGLYPSTHGMVHDEDKIPKAAVTLAEALGAQGFATAGFHDGGYLRADFGFDQGFDLYEDNRGKGFESIIPRALEWLRQTEPSQPFLLFLHTYDTHTPYAPDNSYRGLFLDNLEPPTPGFEPTSETMEKIRTSVWTGSKMVLPDNDLEYAKGLYDAEIRQVDDWVARLVEGLEEMNLMEKSIIVVISDHGEEFQEHGSVLHEKLYTTVTRIPFILVAPGLDGGRVIEHIVETVDLMPTLLELVGASIPEGVQGHSLVPILNGSPPPSDIAFGESPFFGGRRFAAVGGHRLLLTRETGAVELFRFREDPHELVDISTSNPDTVNEMRRRLTEWQTMANATKLPQDADGRSLQEDTIDQLKALGYIQDKEVD